MEPADLIYDIIGKVKEARYPQVILINQHNLNALKNHFIKWYGIGKNPIDLRDNGEYTILGLQYRIAEVEEVEVY